MAALLFVLAYVAVFAIVPLAVLAAVGVTWALAIPLSLIIGTILFRWLFFPIQLRRWRPIAAEFGVDSTTISELRNRSDQPVRGDVLLGDMAMASNALATSRGILFWKRRAPVAGRHFQPLLIPWDRVTKISFENRTYGSDKYLLASVKVTGGPYPEVITDWSKQFNALIPDHVVVEDRTTGPHARFRINDGFD